MRTTELYNPRPTKGLTKDGFQVLMFDAVRPCRDDRCPLDEVCPYSRQGKCQVEMQYLAAIQKHLIEIPRNKMTQEFMDKVTLHLVPLFHQLIRFQIRAYAVEEVCYTTAQGAIKVHPIFAEIRKTIQAVESTQKSLGIDLEYHRALGLAGKGLRTAARGRDPEAYGDNGYTDAMSEEVEEMREEIEDSLFPEGKKDPNLKRAVRRESD